MHGYVARSGALRRSHAVPAASAVAVALVLGLGSAARLAGSEIDSGILWVYDAALVVIAPALVADLLRARWSAGVVTGLVVDLGGTWEPRTLRDRLARALGDSSLELGYRLDGGYVDEAGRSFVLPGAESERVLTSIDDAGERVAVLVHDRVVLDDRALVEAVAAAARLAVANARLQADVRALGADIEASTRRLVDAGAAQRRRLRRELDSRVEPQIDEAAQALHEAHADELAEQLRGVRDQLARFADGLDPVPLQEGGFAAALRALAERAGLPVSLSLSVDRCNADVEACAWFVCSEAIANALKHARATHLSIDVATRASVLRVEVADDGVGAADPSRGSGLRRLAERVRASGGMLTIDSRPGDGTRVIAELDVRGAA
jgi:signal transduction histidine kinase